MTWLLRGDTCTTFEAGSYDWNIRSECRGEFLISISGSKSSRKFAYTAASAGRRLVGGNATKPTGFQILSNEGEYWNEYSTKDTVSSAEYEDFVLSAEEVLTISVAIESWKDTYHVRVEQPAGEPTFQFVGVERKPSRVLAFTVQSVAQDADCLKVLLSGLSGDAFVLNVEMSASWADLKAKIDMDPEQRAEVSLLTVDGNLLLADEAIVQSSLIPISAPQL